jgi:hypothetical protein
MSKYNKTKNINDEETWAVIETKIPELKLFCEKYYVI